MMASTTRQYSDRHVRDVAIRNTLRSGRTYREVAEAFGLSPYTIRDVVARVEHCKEYKPWTLVAHEVTRRVDDPPVSGVFCSCGWWSGMHWQADACFDTHRCRPLKPRRPCRTPSCERFGWVSGHCAEHYLSMHGRLR